MPIALPILIGAAIVDSINPCAFGVLIFLVAYLLKSFAHQRRKILIHGLTYIFAVFITYLLAGLLLLPLIAGIGKLSLLVYGLIGGVIILAGLLELKDAFWYGKGPSLALIPGADKRIELYARKISSSVFGAFGLGVFVALVELPCTGAVYLAILSLLSLVGFSTGAILLLIIYNLIFVLPLVIILVILYKGIDVAKLEIWRRTHRNLMRGALGLTLIGLGAWMLWLALI